ncbi:hypothetical protein HPB52_024603 [Rhipicephalus sanguineus]|uniref:ABC-2 type transporter transmembrane domain-containing protein n=1 Tax=Rhipicephalus sanguineus TaxID=34632 RepID=A0A9D4YS42_RHISA|nr:hypothetical protein HPB52_024603 [Rhipicephalus sanguineus]
MVSKGRCIYNGEVDNLLGFLSRHGLECPQYHNPADYICEIASGDYGDCCDRLSRECEIPEPDKNAVVQGTRSKYGGVIMTSEVVPIALLIGIVYYPTGQPLELWRIASLLLFSVQICSVSQAMALIVSAVSKLQTAVFMVLPVVSPAYFFCGFFVPAHLLSPYIRWMADASYMNYAYNGLLLSIYGYGREHLECDDFICLYEDPAHFLELVGAADKKIHVLTLVLLAFELAARLTAFVLLKMRLSRKE